MGQASTGGQANWTGAAFELRLGVEFCVYILVGEATGLGPGAASSVQLQAPGAVDDVVLGFETGTRWAVQAKAGKSVRVEWNPDRPFGKALRQLHDGAISGQVDLAPNSLDRLVLAVDHRAPSSVTDFGHWLDRARYYYRWEDFVAACTGAEQEWTRKLPGLLNTSGGDGFLSFLRKLYVRRSPHPDDLWSDLRGRLIAAGVPGDGTPDTILDTLLSQVAQAAPFAGRLDGNALRQSCAHIPAVPRAGVPPFYFFHTPNEDDIYRVLKTPAIRPSSFVERPELAGALSSDEGILVAGRPGCGKSHALIKLALTHPEWPVMVIARHFRAEDLTQLTAHLRRIHTPYQLLWDDIHTKPDLFADTVLRLVEQGNLVRVLAAYREQYEADVREHVTPDLCHRVGIDPVGVCLEPFDAGQAARMARTVIEALDLTVDEAGYNAFARHIQRGDGGPLFALATGLLLRERVDQGKTVCAGDIAGLPEDLVLVWHDLYRRLADRPNGFIMQNLLNVMHFLHQIECKPHARLGELLFSRVLGHSVGEFSAAVRTLEGEGWLRREGEVLAAHDVTLAAVPEEQDGFRRFSAFARKGIEEDRLLSGLLRDALGRFFYKQVALAKRGEERRKATKSAADFGGWAARDFRTADSPADLAMSLNNASVFYSALAGLEETRAGRVGLLQQALAAIEEAASLYRELGLQAELASSLNNASNRYSDLAGLEETRAGRVGLLQQALAAIEEAVDTFRSQGIVHYLIVGLGNAVRQHLELAQHTGALDREHVLDMCQEGEKICGLMQEEERLAFFRQARQQLE
jgi:tetratricopeptide (TPR) repeat protein